MRVDILGPLRVTSADAVLPAPMAKERALLEALALRTDHAVAISDLEAALWGDDPPATAAKTLQAHVAHLRHTLGQDVIVREGGGYRLALPVGAVDSAQLEVLVAAGESAWTADDPASARKWFRDAELLWRGEPLVDQADTPERVAQADRLRDLWQQSREGRIRADLALGRHRQVLGELQRLAAEQPAREPICALLMLAFYRSERQLEALRAYRHLAELLIREWGVDPAPELQRLQVQILRQDRQLDLTPPPPPFVVPAPTSSFVGRQGQVESVVAALEQSRLVTLHGPAGVGKSRLAQHSTHRVRSRFADGVWWVDLTPCADGDEVLRRITETLGVTATPGVPMVEWLSSYLAPREQLLVLDNCEQVAEPLAQQLLTLLHTAAHLRVLATSRVLLHLSAELRWEVPPLGVPDADADDEEILASDSVTLFLDRLGRPADPVEPDLAGIARLCRALDGVPLALELVAARGRQATIAELFAQLAVELSRSGTPAASPAHHSTVMRAIDWSYRALDPTTQHLFDWLSVFPSDFDSAAVEAIAARIPQSPDAARRHLAKLVDSSLVQIRVSDEATRYRLLYVMREFAASRLGERSEDEAAWQAFTDHFRTLAVQAVPGMRGAHPGAWLKRCATEMTNLRAAVEWSLEHEPGSRALAFGEALGRAFWSASPDLGSDARRLRLIVERAQDAPPDARAWGWVSLVTTSFLAGDLRGALEACARAEQLFQGEGDVAGLAFVHYHRGAALLLAAGDFAEAERHLRQGLALARQSGVAAAETWCLNHLVQLAYMTDRVTAETLELHRHAEELADPEDIQVEGHQAMNRIGLHLAKHEWTDAIAAAERTEEYCHRVGIPTYEQAGLMLHAVALLGLGRLDAARTTALRAARIALDEANSMQLGFALMDLAPLAAREDPVRAAHLWGAATARAPVIPAYRTLWFPARAAEALGSDFDAEVERGRALSADEAMDLAIG